MKYVLIAFVAAIIAFVLLREDEPSRVPEKPTVEKPSRAVRVPMAPAQREFNKMLSRKQQQKVIDVAELMFGSKNAGERQRAKKRLARLLRQPKYRAAATKYGEDFVFMLKGTSGWKREDIKVHLGQALSGPSSP